MQILVEKELSFILVYVTQARCYIASLAAKIKLRITHMRTFGGTLGTVKFRRKVFCDGRIILEGVVGSGEESRIMFGSFARIFKVLLLFNPLCASVALIWKPVN